MEPITLAEMKARFPDEWLLVGNADLGGEESVGTIIRRLVSGIVLYHSKDKHEVAYNGREARKGYTNCTLIYTGEIPKHLKGTSKNSKDTVSRQRNIGAGRLVKFSNPKFTCCRSDV